MKALLKFILIMVGTGFVLSSIWELNRTEYEVERLTYQNESLQKQNDSLQNHLPK